MMKIKYVKPGYYNCNYPEGAVVEVDDNYGKYAIGMGDAELAKDSDKVTDPVPYVMKPRKTGAEDALGVIAEALTGKKQEEKFEQHPQPKAKPVAPVTKNESDKG